MQGKFPWHSHEREDEMFLDVVASLHWPAPQPMAALYLRRGSSGDLEH